MFLHDVGTYCGTLDGPHQGHAVMPVRRRGQGRDASLASRMPKKGSFLRWSRFASRHSSIACPGRSPMARRNFASHRWSSSTGWPRYRYRVHSGIDGIPPEQEPGQGHHRLFPFSPTEGLLPLPVPACWSPHQASMRCASSIRLPSGISSLRGNFPTRTLSWGLRFTSTSGSTISAAGSGESGGTIRFI